jgi:hypothetical protein
VNTQGQGLSHASLSLVLILVPNVMRTIFTKYEVDKRLLYAGSLVILETLLLRNECSLPYLRLYTLAQSKVD